MKDDFKYKLEEVYIPWIQDMIIKEQKHLDMLIEKRNNHKYLGIDLFITISEKMLLHYKTRLEEYKKYASKI